MRRWVVLILIAALAAMSFAGCSQEQQTEAEETMEGVMEEAGEAADEAGEMLDDAGEAVEGAVDEAEEAVEGVVEDVEEATGM